MSNKQIVECFKKGFSLTNQSLVFYLIGAVLSLLISSNVLFTGSSLNDYISVALVLASIIYFSYSFSLPLFLVDRQQDKPFKLNNILSITLTSAKRLVLPMILLLILLLIIGGTIFFLIAQYVYGGNINYLQNAAQTFSTWNIIMGLLIGLLSFLTFTPVYFSLEGDGLFKSMKKSIKFSFQNLNFIIILFVINMVFSVVSSLPGNSYKIIMNSIVHEYQALFFTAVSLLVYQSRKGRTSPS